MWLHAFLAWLAFLVVIVLLGALREKLLRPRVGEAAAHVLGTLAACAAVAAIGAWTTRRLQPDATEAWLLGAFWLGLGAAFEFGFFGLVMRKPWSQLLADYRFDRGRLLLLLWLTCLLTPVLARPH